MTAYEFDKLQKIRKKQKAERRKIHEEAKFLKKLNRREKQSVKLQKNQREQRNPNEIRFRKLLLVNKIKFVWQQPFYDLERYVCTDFYLPDENIVIELDGFHHENQKEYDLKRTIYLKKVHKVKKVVRIKNSELSSITNKILFELIKAC